MRLTPHLQQRLVERNLPLEWIERVLHHPTRRYVQRDGRIRHWGYIAEIDQYLRVVTEADRETVVTVFIDRHFTGGKGQRN